MEVPGEKTGYVFQNIKGNWSDCKETRLNCILVPTRFLHSFFHRRFLIFHLARCPETGFHLYHGLMRSLWCSVWEFQGSAALWRQHGNKNVLEKKLERFGVGVRLRIGLGLGLGLWLALGLVSRLGYVVGFTRGEGSSLPHLHLIYHYQLYSIILNNNNYRLYVFIIMMKII